MHYYTPIDPSMLDEADAHQLFQNVADHYLKCAANSFEYVEQLSSAPPSARLIWRLWIFLAEVSGSGVCDYLWNHCLSLQELQEIHGALDKVQAVDMRRLLEAGIRSSLDQNIGEFLDQLGAKEWAAQFSTIEGLSDDELNDKSYEVAYPLCSEIIASYIRGHQFEL